MRLSKKRKEFFDTVKHFLDDSEYREKVEGLTSSEIRSYILDPLSIKKPKQEETESLVFGSIMHLGILQREIFEKNEEEILEVLMPKSKTDLLNILDSVKKNNDIDLFLKNKKEVEKVYSAKLKCRDQNIDFKCKIDLLTEDGDLIDFKSSSSLDLSFGYHKIADVRKKTIQSIINKYRYDLQLSLYKDILIKNGESVKKCYIIFIDKKGFNEIIKVKLSNRSLNRGESGNEFFYGYKEVAYQMKYFPKLKRYDDMVI